MISILDSAKERMAIIKDIISPWRFEEINGENKLEFGAILTDKVASYINENNIVEFDDDYFDVAYYTKDLNEDGTATMNVECEHVSYRLNNPEYDMDYFTYIGTPTQVLTQVLNGTGFTVGVVEFTNNITYSAQEKKSRRAIAMEFVALLGGEVNFNKFSVSILNRRGSADLQIFTKGKNIKVISEVFDGRVQPNKIGYTVTPIVLPNRDIGLGDDVLLVQSELGIQDILRVVRVGYNPLELMEKEIEIANYINGLEDQLYRIETTTVAKEKIYNGCRIGPDEGFVAERSDLKAKTIMNATEGISIYSDVGTGLERNFFVDLEGRIQARGLDISGDATFQGSISASTIDIGNGSFTVDINGNMVSTSGYFEGTIESSDIVGGTIDIGNGTFTVDNLGNLYAESGTFMGDIIGGAITSDSTINVTTDVTIGKNLYMNSNSLGEGIFFDTWEPTGIEIWDPNGGLYVTGGLHVEAYSGYDNSGTFDTADGQTIRVRDGIIIDIYNTI